MQRRVGAIAALAALTACSFALPAIAQDNSTNQNPTQNQNNTNTNQSGNTSNGTTSTNTMYMQPVAPDFQSNIDKSIQTLDNIVKLLDAIEARKAQAAKPSQ